ncbi:MAG: FHA domain-containing protein [Verrucomicrobia bacterium]|jgi:pSer/pThr/pTyr-binding forkhead associated (FHA) protein|nr:FHA domain-containing protein [Verrucomicrobiota bacterium]
MFRLVVTSEGLKGTSHELKVDRTTIGRVEDNTFQIPEASISSHHCEVLRSGAEVVIKDLDSTNGSFINGEKITQSPLKPGQTLRLGQVELQLIEGEGAPVPAPATPAPAPKPPAAPVADQTMVMKRGVSLSELEQGPVAGFDTTSTAFSKKTNQVNRWFIIGGAIIGAAILIVIVVVAFSMK